MRTRPVERTIAVSAALLGAASLAPAQGGGGTPLDPPAGPVAPTMKTLDQVEPRTPVGPETTPGDANSVFRIAQPGSYYLTGNLDAVSGDHGVEIASGGVTLDLRGFELRGTPGSLDGVHVSGFPDGVVVRNGTVRDWDGDGVDASSATGSALVEIRAEGNGGDGLRVGQDSVVRACAALNNGDDGLFVSNGGRVSDCAATENAGDGIETFSDAVLTGCTARRNSGHGISVNTGCVVSRSAATQNSGTGILAGESTRLERCAARGNDGEGIRVDGDGATVEDNVSRENADDGIEIDADHCVVKGNASNNNGDGPGGEIAGNGILVVGSRNQVSGNTVTQNDRGVVVTDNGNIIIKNIAAQNNSKGASMDYVIASSNVVGVIVDAPTSGPVSGDSGGDGVGTTDPWANIAY